LRAVRLGVGFLGMSVWHGQCISFISSKASFPQANHGSVLNRDDEPSPKASRSPKKRDQHQR